MIGARYARPLRANRLREPKRSTIARAARHEASRLPRPPVLALLVQPAIAGRQRIVSALSQSILVQLMLAMTFVALAALLYLAQASQASVLQFNIADLQARRSQLDINNASLQASVNSLQSPGRIDSLAAGKLHMVRPNLTNTIWITPVAPRISLRVPRGELAAAGKQSQPAASISRFLRFVASSL
jgi:cell division protein FtsL